jgi:hypothetical protein
MFSNKQLDSLDLLFNKGVEGGGITIKNGKEVRYQKGYQVSNNTISKFGYHYRKEARAFFKELIEMVTPQQYIGIYISDGGNTIYIEESFYIEDLNEAMELGIKWKQESIYDWENNDLIWLRYCKITGEYITEGFYYEGTFEGDYYQDSAYYKNEEALRQDFTEEEQKQGYEEGWLYWTSWEE